jgi:hypothetical protein
VIERWRGRRRPAGVEPVETAKSFDRLNHRSQRA